MRSRLILASAGLDGIVPVIVAAGDTPRGKPAPDPYRRAMERLSAAYGRHLRPERVGGHRGLALGARVGARRRDAHGGPDDELCGVGARAARSRRPDIAEVTPARSGRSSPRRWRGGRRRDGVNARLVDEFLRRRRRPTTALRRPRWSRRGSRIRSWTRPRGSRSSTCRRHGAAASRARRRRTAPARTRLRVVSEFFFGQLGFVGNREHYEDPRNSFLNDVIARAPASRSRWPSSSSRLPPSRPRRSTA